MLPEASVRQRGLVDRRIVFADAERTADYMFPFIDRRWRVPLIVLDLSMGPPRILDGPFRVDQVRFRTPLRTSDLRRSESAGLDRLQGIDAKRGPFRAMTFRPGDIELLTLRSSPLGRPDLLRTRLAKAL